MQKKINSFAGSPAAKSVLLFFALTLLFFNSNSFAQGFYTPLLAQAKQPGFSQKHLEQISFSKPAAAEKLCTAIKPISKT